MPQAFQYNVWCALFLNICGKNKSSLYPHVIAYKQN